MYLMCASGFIINSKNQFLMLKRSDGAKFLPGYWEIPGGIVEDGEDPVLGLLREIKEESGLDVLVSNPLKVICYFQDPVHPRESYGILYFCRPSVEDQPVKISHEHSDYKWVDLHDSVYPEPINKFLKDNIEYFKKYPLVSQ